MLWGSCWGVQGWKMYLGCRRAKNSCCYRMMVRTRERTKERSFRHKAMGEKKRKLQVGSGQGSCYSGVGENTAEEMGR